MNNFFLYFSFLLLSLALMSCHKNKKNVIDWFDKGARNCDLSKVKDLHSCSRWGYLSSEQFAETVMDGIDSLNPPLKDNESFFELGVGVGAAIQVITKNRNNLTFGGSDLSEESIRVAKKVFPSEANMFFVKNMINKHQEISDNSFDHVFSFGALGMYLKRNDMIKAIQEAVRMTKPGGSLLFTNFIEPDGNNVGSIVDKVEKTFWDTELPKLGLENITIKDMKNQGDRYQILCNKSS